MKWINSGRRGGEGRCVWGEEGDSGTGCGQAGERGKKGRNEGERDEVKEER